MSEFITAALLLIGAAFMLLASIGVLRLPDLFTRMQAATKAATLGAGCLLVAVAISFGELGVATRALAAVAFVVFTAPVAAHMIGRAAYFVAVPLWEGTIVDELRGRYEPTTHVLSSGPQPPSDVQGPS
ncbi:MAG: monovalent cation/H(+) antiporter subunit G [Candidatus Acidiferrales bacterium]